MNILDITISVLFSVLIGSGLLKFWISERLKQGIKSEYDQKLEVLRSEHRNDALRIEHSLELARLEAQIKQSGVHKKQMEAIEKIHFCLINIHKKLSEYTSIFGEMSKREELRLSLSKATEEFWNVFNPNRIYLRESLDDEIVKYIKVVNDTAIDFMMEVEGEPTAKVERWNEIYKTVGNHWVTVLTSIRRQFKEILGVEFNG